MMKLTARKAPGGQMTVESQTPNPPPSDEDIALEDDGGVGVVDVPGNIRQLVINIQSAATDATEAIAKALRRKPEDATGFKVIDEPEGPGRWMAIYTNNLVDRDGEIFTEKAIDDFVARVDAGTDPLPELWIWHTPGSRIGQADWVERHGHFLMAVGTFDETPEAQHAKAYYAANAKKLGVSHGFVYPPATFDGKHYHQFSSFEISPLPAGKEANFYTTIEGIKAMSKVISEKRRQHLIDVLGEERALKLLESLEESGKALEELGVEYKGGNRLTRAIRGIRRAKQEAEDEAALQEQIAAAAEKLGMPASFMTILTSVLEAQEIYELLVYAQELEDTGKLPTAEQPAPDAAAAGKQVTKRSRTEEVIPGGFWGLGDEKALAEAVADKELTFDEKQARAAQVLLDMSRERRAARNARKEGGQEKPDTMWGAPVNEEYRSLYERVHLNGVMSTDQIQGMIEDKGIDATVEHMKMALDANSKLRHPFWGTRRTDR